MSLSEYNEQRLRQAARTMLETFTAKVQSLEGESERSPLRYNLTGWQEQAVDFIVQMAKTYHANEPQESN